MPLDQVYWTWLNDEWRAGRLTRPGRALEQLRANPRQFLGKFALYGNYDPAVSGPATINLVTQAPGFRPGSVMGNRNMHTAESFSIQAMPGNNGDGHPFRVHGLFTAASNVNPIAWYRLDGNGPDIMLTAKLRGCTFIARAVPGHPGSVDVAHLQPNGEDGLALNNRLAVAGQQAFGRNNYDYTTRTVNIVGVRRGGQWKIYAQKLEKNAKQATIRSVKRIYPA